LVPNFGTLAGRRAVRLGIRAVALMALGFLAWGVVMRAVAGCRAKRVLTTVLLCAGLSASAANAEPLAPDAKAQPQPSPVGAPMLGQAENATVDANSLKAEGSSPFSTAAPLVSINPKSAQSDQNCLGLAKASGA